MKYYVVVDTNVLLSAILKANSSPAIIVQLIKNQIIIPLVNNKILTEYKDVLSRPKFKFSADQIDKAIKEITKEALIIEEDHIEIELPDEKDRIFYEVVEKSNKERESLLVTGNIKHFPSKPFILTPRELCDIIINTLSREDFIKL